MSPALAKLLMCVCAGGTGAAVIPAARAIHHRVAPNHSPVRKVAAVAAPCEPIFTAGPSVGVPDMGFVAPGGPTELGSVVPLADGASSNALPLYHAGYAPGGGGGGRMSGGQPGIPVIPGSPGTPVLVDTPPVSPVSGGGNPNTPTVSNAPEPAAWAMMISGFGLLGGAMRYSRRTGSAAA